jgi:hypothetical protein
MSRHRTLVIVVISFVALLGVLAAAPQRPSDPTDLVAREIRDLRLAMERASAVSAQVTIAAMQASAAQGRLASVNVELATVRTQIVSVTSTLNRQRQLVTDFERDFPEAVSDASMGLRLPQYQEYQRAKMVLNSTSQQEDPIRARENELLLLQGREQAQLNQLFAKLEALEQALNERRQ